MGTGIFFVWGFALLAIAGLSIALYDTVRKKEPWVDTGNKERQDDLLMAHDTLLFYYEETSVRQTADQKVTVLLPSRAWDSGWQEDLLRIEIDEIAPDSVALDGRLENAELLTVYLLSVFRMTEMGVDLQIDHFLAPISVVLTAERQESGDLEFAFEGDQGIWHIGTKSLGVDERKQIKLLPEQEIIKGEITRPGKIGLFVLGKQEEMD